MPLNPISALRRGRLVAACFVIGCATGPRVAATGPAGASPAEAAAATGAIKGLIKDAQSAQPVSFVDVVAIELGGRRISDTTRSDGTFRIADLVPGLYCLTATYSGHTVRYDNVSVAANATVDLVISIDAEAGDVTIDYAAGDDGASDNEPSSTAAARHTGSIRGVVRDSASHEELPGAVVAATTPGLRDARMAIADDDGSYLLPSLPPGTYTLSVYYHLIERGNVEIRRTNIQVAPGEIAVVDLDLDAETDL